MSKSKKFQKQFPITKETTMGEEVKNEPSDAVEETAPQTDIQNIDTAQVEPEVASEEVVAEVETPPVETVAAQEIINESIQANPIDLGVKDEAAVPPPAVNIAADLPQESDPIVDGSLEKVMENVPTAPVAPIVVPPVAPAVVEEIPTDKSEEEQYLDKIRISGTVEQKRMLAAIETFVDRMKPRVEIEPSKGVVYQAEFLDHLLWLLKKDYESFRGGWNVLLIYFSLYHGINSARSYTALSEFSTTRFLFAWTKGLDKCNCYRNLITLLRATRHKETRKHDIKTINLEFIGPNVLTEVELNNLKQFYQV